MATISERLRQAMSIRNIKQVDLVKATGIGKSSISTYLAGDYKPKQQRIYKLAKALNVSEAWLLGYDVPMQPEPSNIIRPDGSEEYVKIPVIGRVAAGLGCLADNEIIGYEYTDAEDINGVEDYRFLRVVGDSMYPEFKEGDLVLVRCQTSVDSGSYAVVIIDGEDGVIKKIVYDKDFIELHSINPMYPVRRFEGEDVLRIQVFGLVKEIKRKF